MKLGDGASPDALRGTWRESRNKSERKKDKILTDDRSKIWETLFEHALTIIDSAALAGMVIEGWSFGGGTVLMRRHHHRFSKDIDIFLPDPQYLGYLTPRLNTTAESLTPHYVEQHGFIKLFFPEGEIDFVASGHLTPDPTVTENLLGRDVLVETSTEIIAKKVWHRGNDFAARDIFDLAMVAEKEQHALQSILPILRGRRNEILKRIEQQGKSLRETFDQLEILDYRRTYDECVEIVRELLTS